MYPIKFLDSSHQKECYFEFDAISNLYLEFSALRAHTNEHTKGTRKKTQKSGDSTQQGFLIGTVVVSKIRLVKQTKSTTTRLDNCNSLLYAVFLRIKLV